MTIVLYTVDTELSPALHQRGLTPLENIGINITGQVADGAWGVGYQMARLDAHGLKGVFFVEALSALVYGIDVLKHVVDLIATQGHEVQLHLHTEWLRWSDKDIVGNRRGMNIADFDAADQRRLLETGVEMLVRAGASKPTAFRAGNFGANNDTLRAAAAVGFTYDSSYSEPSLGLDCKIDVPSPLLRPTELDGIVEVPVTHFADYPGHTRPAQLCAVSQAEMKWVIERSVANARPTTVIVSHSFELLNQKRTRVNAMLRDRFERLCAAMKGTTGARPGVFGSLGDDILGGDALPLNSHPGRTVSRMIEQVAGGLIYDRS